MSPDSQGRALGEFPGGANAVEYEFPLGEDRRAYLTLPRNLTLYEAKRIAAFLLTLVDVNATQYPVGGSPTRKRESDT